VNWLRWPLLAVIVIFGLSVLYRYAPDRRNARWRWVSWGAVAATVLWLMGSGLFSVYVANFGRYNETYGSIGAVVVLLLWFYLSAFVFLAGAELNAEMEHQTNRDTTVGGDQPRGQRQAYVADDVGHVPGSKTGSWSR
jgi:membrane protein